MKTIHLMLALSLFVSTKSFSMGAQKPKPPDQSEVLDPGEPSYCDPKTFLSKEVTMPENKLANAHQFQLGEVTVVGLGVGSSKTEELKAYATTRSTASASSNYCTWYYNEGNAEAEKSFTHIYLNNPKSLDTTTGPDEYGEKLKNQFGNSAINFISCAADHKYLAFGCNGMKHRGPTVFGMMLAFSGCKAERAAYIANVVWGLNQVKEEVRLAIVQKAKDMGDKNPSQREQMQNLLGYK
jgi:hypothetical protein